MAKKKKEMYITATHFYNLLRCPTKVYLDLFGKEKDRLKVSEFLQKKINDGIEHELAVISDMDFVEVKEVDPIKAAKKTVELMKKGEAVIYQGVLIKDNLLGRPDLLVKVSGESDLGDYHYMASDIKSGKYLKEEYRMQVVFYSFLLQKIQGVLPVKGQIINANNEKLDFDINDLMQRFAEVYYKVQKTIDGEKSSPVVSAQCKECIWRDGCLKESIKNKDLGLITGLGREIRDKLNEMGIKNLKDFLLSKSQLKY